MRRTTPRVWLIARPSIDWDTVTEYLRTVDGHMWVAQVLSQHHASSEGERLTEFAGRLCYRSWKPGLNPNVTKVREDSQVYLENILKQKHGSVLEHAQYSFVFQDVSRVFTHELVRHRAGAAVSQESLRFVRLTDIGFNTPEALSRRNQPLDKNSPTTMEHRVVELVEQLEEFQREAAVAFGLDDEGTPFHYKKEVTSALRRLLPEGVATTVLWSANIRTIRWVLEARTAPGAEAEIRLVFDNVGRLMKRELPILFGDFERDNSGTWTPTYSKV